VGVYAVALAVLMLPLLGVVFSYLAETRRGVANAVVATSLLALLAAAVLLGAVVSGGRVVHSDTLTFWTFQVVQAPFNAAATTVLSSAFAVGIGYSATPTAAILALLVTLVTLLCELQLLRQFHRDPRLGTLVRLANLLSFGALLVVLAPELFQVLVGFEVCGFVAALMVGLAAGPRLGGMARQGYLAWRVGGLSLLLGVAFIYVKFSGPVATAAAAAAAAAAKHKVTLPTPDGLNLAALAHVWVAATKGQAPDVGARSLTLAGVLILVAAAFACGLLPGHGLWRSLGSAPGAGAGLLLGIAGAVVGTALLLDAYPLLRVASGVLPALVVLATLSSVVAAGLALREHRLRRLALWVAASQTGTVLAGLGLGSPAAGLALLISSVLATTAVLGLVTTLGRDQRVESIDQLGAAWRLARPTVLAFLAALVAATGVLGLGTFFGHAAVLGAALGGAGQGSSTPPELFRVVAAAGELVAVLLVAGACARVALIAVRGAESSDPRVARMVRRQLAQGRGLGQLWPSLVATALALISGLVSLPGISWGVGGLLDPKTGTSALGVQPLGLLLTLVVPLLALAALAAARRSLAGSAGTEPVWLEWADGTRLAVAAEALSFGAPARAVEWARTRVLDPAADAAAGALGGLLGQEPGPTSSWRRWSLASSLVALVGVALTVAIVVWVATSQGAGVGLP